MAGHITKDVEFSKKRTATTISPLLQTPAQRMRIENLLTPNGTQSSQQGQAHNATGTCSAHSSSQSHVLTPAPMPVRTSRARRFIVPPTPFPSPEPKEPFINKGVDRDTEHLHTVEQRPDYNERESRNEFPFPIITGSEQPRNKRLILSIPEEPAEYDTQIPNELIEPSQVISPPRSHPVCLNSFPPFAFSTKGSPAPSSPDSSSRIPSLTSSQAYSPLSPKLPDTPTSRFHSAANSLKCILMADDLGMSAQELEELNKFATAPMSGGSKRAGRVLVHKDLKQRKLKGTDVGRTNGIWQDPYHRRQECAVEDCSRHTTPGVWREIDWSKFSDSSDDEMADTDAGYASDEEMSTLDGYIRMAISADRHPDVGDADTPPEMIVGTAKVAKKAKPSRLTIRATGINT